MTRPTYFVEIEEDPVALRRWRVVVERKGPCVGCRDFVEDARALTERGAERKAAGIVARDAEGRGVPRVYRVQQA